MQNVELARQEGQEYRRVSLTASDQGVRVEAFDAGPTAGRFFGKDEYEFWVDVKAEALPALVFALLKERFSGQLGAVDQFRDFCERNGVPHEFDSWS